MIINVKIEGTSPLLQNRFIENPPKTDPKHLRRDDVAESLYRGPNSVIYQPAEHLFKAMIHVGSRFKVAGKGKMTYKKIIKEGGVIVYPDAITHLIQDWEIDRRPVVINRARVMKSRPMLNDWELEFSLDIDEDEVDPAILKEVLDYAGKRSGIGDYRPQNGGHFGRFQVVSWKIEK